jgi:hypothetical protein
MAHYKQRYVATMAHMNKRLKRDIAILASPTKAVGNQLKFFADRMK